MGHLANFDAEYVSDTQPLGWLAIKKYKQIRDKYIIFCYNIITT
jgi:hypothetical protein